METHTYPGIGEDAQDVINKQIDDDYDIFIGLMWKASSDMQIYVRRMETEMPIFKESYGNGFDYLTRAYSLYYTDWKEGAKEEIDTFQKIEELFECMTTFQSEMHSLKNKISLLPRATTKF